MWGDILQEFSVAFRLYQPVDQTLPGFFIIQELRHHLLDHFLGTNPFQAFFDSMDQLAEHLLTAASALDPT